MNISDINDYIGKPFAPNGRGPDGYDCWGLARAVLLRFRECDIPHWGMINFNDIGAQKMITKGLKQSLAKEYVKPIETPQDFDLALLMRSRVAFHIGIYIQGRILHVRRDMMGVSHERIEEFKIVGGEMRYYRWVK